MREYNRAILKKITNRSLLFNKKRNCFIIIAITLTAFMLTATFSIGLSMFETVHAQHIRLEGSISHGAFANPTPKQLERLSTLDYVEMYGTSIFVGTVEELAQTDNIQLTLGYVDEMELGFLTPAWVDFIGNYPQSIDEIMISRGILERIGIDNPEVGMQIPISYLLFDENMLPADVSHESTFTLSGFFTDFLRDDWWLVFISEEFVDQYEKNVQENGFVNIIFSNENDVWHNMNRLVTDLELTSEQQLTMVTNPIFDFNDSEQMITILIILVFMFMLTGYLLIYSVLYISIVKDVRFYGILKTIGTTPKQIGHIVMRQIIRLCLVGIPLGILLGAIVSFVLIPLSVSNSDIQTGIIISFSPIIYIGATIFSLLTAIIGAILPAKKAAGISAIEAVKYTGEINVKSNSKKLTRGNLYKMAFRNIFRDRKRTAVVLFNLFFGITIFVVSSIIISSFDADKFAHSEVESDFVLRNDLFFEEGISEQTFMDDFFERVNALTGIRRIDKVMQEPVVIKYTESFDLHVEAFIEQHDFRTWKEEEITRNFVGVVTGIDKEALIEVNNNLENPIDLEAFDRGEFALIATERPYIYDTLIEIEATLFSNENTFVIPVGGFLPYGFRGRGFGTSPILTVIPIIFVSNSFLEEFIEVPLISNVHIDVEDGYDEEILLYLRGIRSDANYNFSIYSRIEARQAMQEWQTTMYILGGSLASILSLTGILNFINSISVGIISRKREFATLESIGMTRGQLCKMLIYEGLWYATITIMLVAVIGNGIAIGLYKLVERQFSEWMNFSYPVFPVLSTVIIILFIGIIVLTIACRSINKISIVDRLRDVE